MPKLPVALVAFFPPLLACCCCGGFTQVPTPPTQSSHPATQQITTHTSTIPPTPVVPTPKLSKVLCELRAGDGGKVIVAKTRFDAERYLRLLAAKDTEAIDAMVKDGYAIAVPTGTLARVIKADPPVHEIHLEGEHAGEARYVASAVVHHVLDPATIVSPPPTPRTQGLPPFSEGVVLNLDVTVQDDNRALVHGRTNLPPGTHLGCRVEEARLAGFSGGTSGIVEADGYFRIGPFGPTSGLPQGAYEANLTMPISQVQPDGVRAVIGKDGENLRGPLVAKGSLGTVVRAKKDFTVGGSKGLAAQEKQDASDRERFERVYRDVVTLGVEVEAMINKKAGSAEWAKFLLELREKKDKAVEPLGSPPLKGVAFLLAVAAEDAIQMAMDSRPNATRPNVDYFRKSHLDNLRQVRKQLDNARR